MTHLSLINELAQDFAKLSQTLTAIAALPESALMQQTAENSVEKNLEQEKTPAKQAKAESAVSGTESPVENKPVVTIEQVRAVMAEKSQAGLTGQVKQLLQSFGAVKLSGVNPEDYGRLMEAAKALN